MPGDYINLECNYRRFTYFEVIQEMKLQIQELKAFPHRCLFGSQIR